MTEFAFLVCGTILIVLTLGTPDLLDTIIHNLQSCQ